MESVSKWWNEKFKQYAIMIGGMYLKNPEQILSDLKWGSVIECLNESYQALVKEGELIPIEDLSLEKKQELWERAIKIDTDKKKRILISKAIYLLEKITE